MIFCLIFFGWSLDTLVKDLEPTGEVLSIHITIDQAAWKFMYEDGQSTRFLYVHAGQTVKLLIGSDVHQQNLDQDRSIFNYRYHTGSTPKRQSPVVLELKHSGSHQASCQEKCNPKLLSILSKVRIISADDFSKRRDKGFETDINKKSLEEQGEELSAQHNCESCHSLNDDTQLSGPPLWKIFGRHGVTETGDRFVANEAYLRESLVDPQAKIVKGFPNSMPSFKEDFNNTQLDAMIAFMKSLK